MIDPQCPHIKSSLPVPDILLSVRIIERFSVVLGPTGSMSIVAISSPDMRQLRDIESTKNIAIPAAWPLGAVRGQAAKPDIAEDAVILERDEANVGSPGGALIGVVTCDDTDTPGTVPPPPDVAMSERTGREEVLRLRPPVELLQRGNAAIPGRGGDARADV